VSLPIFTGFGRSLGVARAEEAQQDADEQVRATSLQLEALVTERYLALDGAFRAVAIQELSRQAAREQLRLAQDRYRLGSGNATELSDAQNAVALGEGNYVNAVYAYHRVGVRGRASLTLEEHHVSSYQTRFGGDCRRHRGGRGLHERGQAG